MMTRNDAELRALHARLRDLPRQAPGSLPPETIQALAEGSYHGADREALLDEVLDHPAMAAEFRLFRDLAREAPQRAPRHRQVLGGIGLAAAAMLVVALGTRAILRDAGEGPLRGPGSGVVLLAPGPVAAPGEVRFTWRAVPGARNYVLEVARTDGTPLVRTVTTDTTATAALGAGVSGGMRWWVTVRRGDGTTQRSQVQALDLRRR